MVAQNNFAERLAEARARGAKLRSDAFVDYSPVVCGFVLQPVTLTSYNRLLGLENAFAVGGPLGVEAIIGWVWLQHPSFGQMAAKARRQVFRGAWGALHPRFPVLNWVLRTVGTLPRFRWLSRFAVPSAQERCDEAIEEIRRLMAEALYGFPTATEEPSDADDSANDGKPPEGFVETPAVKTNRLRERYQPKPAVAFQAQVLNTFRRQYGMSYAETESLPLKKLAQLWREHIHASGGDKTGISLMDAEEARVWAEEIS